VGHLRTEKAAKIGRDAAAPTCNHSSNTPSMPSMMAVEMLGLVSGFWQWLEDASQGQATFIGSLIGSSIGLIALLLGALFNAHLNRRRDNHLRREERETVAAALLAELVGIRNGLSGVVILLKEAHEHETGSTVTDVVRVRVLPDMVSKLGLLGPSTIHRVLSAYSEAEGLRDALMREGTLEPMHGLLTPRIAIPGRSIALAFKMTISAMAALDHAIADLETKSSAREPAVG